MTEETMNTAVNTEEAGTTATEEVKTDAELDNGGENTEFSDGDGKDGGRSEKVDAEEKQKNAENAYRRRESERRARELEAVRVQTIIDAVGVNPFTDEEIKDAEDVAEYLAMKEIQKNGGDPVNDYAKHQKEKARKMNAAAKEEQKTREWFENDKAAFVNKHPDVDLDTLISDSDFADYADGKVGRIPLADIYEGYNAFVKRSQKSADAKAAQALANKKASPGALSGGTAPQSEYFTPEKVRGMSRAEVHKNYDKIRASMKTWK